MVTPSGHKRCPDCGVDKPVSEYFVSRKASDGYQSHCRPCQSLLKRAANLILKQEVFDAYGGRCECPHCNIDQLDFLTIDHINGDGAASKRNGEGSGTSLWRYLKRNGYPKGRHRVLCFNCNCARRFGPCPHERLSLLPAAESAHPAPHLCFDFKEFAIWQ